MIGLSCDASPFQIYFRVFIFGSTRTQFIEPVAKKAVEAENVIFIGHDVATLNEGTEVIHPPEVAVSARWSNPTLFGLIRRLPSPSLFMWSGSSSSSTAPFFVPTQSIYILKVSKSQLQRFCVYFYRIRGIILFFVWKRGFYIFNGRRMCTYFYQTQWNFIHLIKHEFRAYFYGYQKHENFMPLMKYIEFVQILSNAKIMSFTPKSLDENCLTEWDWHSSDKHHQIHLDRTGSNELLSIQFEALTVLTANIVLPLMSLKVELNNIHIIIWI